MWECEGLGQGGRQPQLRGLVAEATDSRRQRLGQAVTSCQSLWSGDAVSGIRKNAGAWTEGDHGCAPKPWDGKPRMLRHLLRSVPQHYPASLSLP